MTIVGGGHAASADFSLVNARIYTEAPGTAFAVRAVLDLASRDMPIERLGDDVHHGAFNSAARARAA